MKLPKQSQNFRVPFSGKLKIGKFPTSVPGKMPDKDECEALLAASVTPLDKLQQVLYAQNKYSILCIFQAIDAAGKDSTIRAVFGKINPAGCQVHNFKQPSKEELDHDFLWRTACDLPERGRIGIYNRSYYEEVLVVRVHPEYLDAQNLPDSKADKKFWKQRMESIRDHERHLERNGTVILKFWLNISKEEQGKRLLSRLENPAKNWKFMPDDLTERKLRPQYLKAYEDVLHETSRPWAPWYAIPADNKPYMRLIVAEILVDTLEKLPLEFPKLEKKEQQAMAGYKKILESE